MTSKTEGMVAFSIVIPLYNKEHAIASTLESVLLQTFQEFEVIIIDDGSTDNSASIVTTFQDPRILCIRQENQGVSAARNVGMGKANYPYIAFLDADDTWSTDYLASMAMLIRDFPGATIYGMGNVVLIGDKVIQRNFHLPAGFRGYVTDYFQHAVRSELFWTSAVVASTSTLQQSGGFLKTLSLGEDTDMWIRLALMGPVVFDANIKTQYRLTPTNSSFLASCTFENQFLGHTERYTSSENVNRSFRRYINVYRWSKLARMFASPGITNAQEIEYLRLIKPDVLPMYARIFLRLPRSLQKKILRFRNTHVNR
jgi:glycosyltransferase involved in cell wall biosynthesis